jgi:sulfatase maturation enzyme AslB (radical SAM superfamily)
MKLIQRGNAKLPGMYMFNIPANHAVCNRTCKSCYAIKEQVRFPAVLEARERRFQAALQPDFASKIISELRGLRKQPKHFRVHSSGEFFSQPYINDWYRIASTFPQITFYAYTKRIKDFDFSKLKSLSNFIVIDSFHYGGLNYGKLDKAPSNAFICPHQPGTNVICGQTCDYCMQKTAETKAPYFKQH